MIQDGTTAAEFGEQIVLKIHSNKGNNKESVTLIPPGKSKLESELLRTPKEKPKKTQKNKSQNVSWVSTLPKKIYIKFNAGGFLFN